MKIHSTLPETSRTRGGQAHIGLFGVRDTAAPAPVLPSQPSLTERLKAQAARRYEQTYSHRARRFRPSIVAGASAFASVPRVVPGRVYCVERINFTYGHVWLRLVGVREHKAKCQDDRGLPAFIFRHVGRRGSKATKGEA